MPLRLIALGLLLVALDLRVDRVDVVPDLLGWLLVALAVRRLAGGDRTASALVISTVAAAVLSLGDLVRVHVVSTVYDVSVSAVLVLLANYLAIRAGRSDDVDAETLWLRLRNVILVASAAQLGLALFSGVGPLVQLYLAVLIVSLVALLAVVVTLVRHAGRPWAR